MTNAQWSWDEFQSNFDKAEINLNIEYFDPASIGSFEPLVFNPLGRVMTVFMKDGTKTSFPVSSGFMFDLFRAKDDPQTIFTLIGSHMWRLDELNWTEWDSWRDRR